jgi:hypothetical protein
MLPVRGRGVMMNGGGSLGPGLPDIEGFQQPVPVNRAERTLHAWRPDRPRRRELTDIPLDSRTQSGLLRRHDH